MDIHGGLDDYIQYVHVYMPINCIYSVYNYIERDRYVHIKKKTMH